MAEDAWILGIHMTKFGKYPDKDTTDLAAEAAMGALADAGVTMKEMGVLGFGNLMGGSSGQTLQKQVGQTGIPVYNVSNACATGPRPFGWRSCRSSPVRRTSAWRSGWRSWPEPACSPVAAGWRTPTRGPRKVAWARSRRWTGASAPTPCPACSPRSGWSTPIKYGGADFELFAQISEKNHAHSTLNPMAAYQKKFTLDEIMNDVMIAYPNTRPMCSANCDGAAAAVVVSDSKLKTLSAEQRRRAVKISASILTTDPWEEACQVLPNVNTLTRNAAVRPTRRPASARGSRPRRAARLLRYRRTGPLRQLDALRGRRRRRLLPQRRHLAGRQDARSTSPEAWSPRAIPSRLPASPTSGRCAPTCAARAAPARSRAPRWAWPM